MSGCDPRYGLGSAWHAIEAATLRAAKAELAASHAAAAAQRQDRLAARGGLAADTHTRLAAAHRATERCHLVAARMHRDYAWMMTSWARLADEGAVDGPRPVLMGAVTYRAGWRGSVLTLYTSAGVEEMVAASDPQARRAHELEVSLGEGPSLEALRGRSSLASGEVLRRRWPQYAREVAELGVQAVGAVPVALGSGLVGSLTVTGSAVPEGWLNEHLTELAVALIQVLVPPGAPAGEADALGLDAFEDEDFQPKLHQAAGVLSERHGLRIDDAIALLRAHAYGEERSVADVAAEMLRGGLLEP